MAISIPIENEQAIRRHGEEIFPHECCGFMLGTVDGDAREVVELLPVDNDREDGARHNRFLIAPDDFLKGEKTARAKGLDVIGIYHSHPNAPARPSQYDLDHAWPWYSYVIVSIMDSVADNMTSWILDDDRKAFSEEDIVVTETQSTKSENAS